MLDEELELDDGALLAPLPALPLGVLELGALLAPLVLEPPEAESFFVASAAEDELDEDGELGVLALPDMEPEPDAEPEGELGVVELEPLDDDAPEPGVVRETARSPSVLSQPASIPAPSARETATAKAESLIVWASMVGVKPNGARFRPDAVPS